VGLPCFGTPAVVPFPLQNAVSVEWVPMAYPPHGTLILVKPTPSGFPLGLYMENNFHIARGS